MRLLADFPKPKTLLFITLTALPFTTGLFFLLQVIDQQLAPYGIVTFEFAFAPARARQMFAVWGAAGAAAARQSLWVDFAFMPAYAFLFAGLTLLAARTAKGRWQMPGFWLALAPFAAWALDATENVSLLRALEPAPDPSSAVLVLAGMSAAVKFLLLAACLVYMIGIVIAAGWTWLSARPQ